MSCINQDCRATARQQADTVEQLIASAQQDFCRYQINRTCKVFYWFILHGARRIILVIRTKSRANTGRLSITDRTIHVTISLTGDVVKAVDLDDRTRWKETTEQARKGIIKLS